MNKEEILNLTAMPIGASSYGAGPFRFINREYFIITYKTDPDLIRAILPEPLQPWPEPLVHYEFINMPDSNGCFGSYLESGIVFPCLFHGEKCNFTYQMYLNNHPPIAGGREIWGFPKKYAQPSLEVKGDTLVGKLFYADELVSRGTMAYKYKEITRKDEVIKTLTTTQINLKLIPGADGKPEIAKLIGYNMTDVVLKEAWEGKAMLDLVPHATAPLAEIPVRSVVGGYHYIVDITLPYGRVLHDYLKN